MEEYDDDDEWGSPGGQEVTRAMKENKPYKKFDEKDDDRLELKNAKDVTFGQIWRTIV